MTAPMSSSRHTTAWSNRTRTATSSSSTTQGPMAGSSRRRHWRRVQRPTSVMGPGAAPKAPRSSRPGPTSALAATCAAATQQEVKEVKEEAAKAPSQEARAPDEAPPWLSDGRTRRGRWPPHSARRGCSLPSARRRSPQQPECSCWLPGSHRRKRGSPNGPHRSRLPRPGGIRISNFTTEWKTHVKANRCRAIVMTRASSPSTSRPASSETPTRSPPAPRRS